MKEFNREKDFNKIKNPRRNIIIFSISLFLLGILSIFTYKSYALFKINSEHIIINAVVGNFFSSKEFSYTGDVQEFTVPISGYYKIELWGAEGYRSGYGGKGGYSKGIIYLLENEKLYIYVGQYGASGCRPYTNCTGLAFNGGGSGGYWTQASYPARVGGGGGATDVRLVSGNWNESTSLRSRIMVAGAGGGADAGEIAPGGAGGGLIGGNGVRGTSGSGSDIGRGGTQMTGGISSGTAGSFGVGSNARIVEINIVNCNGGLGGGGGYYGGSGGVGGYAVCPNTSASGGGGSSYISGYAGSNSVTSATSTVPANNTLHYSGKYFINTKMESGINTGNGKAKISYVGEPQRTNTNLDNVRYIKSCMNGYSSAYQGSNIWSEIQAIVNGENIAKGKTVTSTGTFVGTAPASYAVDGDISVNFAHTSQLGLQCITVDLGAIYNLDEVMLANYWNETYVITNQNTLSVGDINISGTTSLKSVLHTYTGAADYRETREGKRYTAWD